MASIENCKLEFKENLRKLMTEKEAEEQISEFEDIVYEKMKDKDMTELLAISEARRVIRDRIDENLKKAEFEKAFNLSVFDQNYNYIVDNKDPISRARALYVGSVKQFEGARDSLEAWQKGEMNRVYGKFLSELYSKGVYDKFFDKEFQPIIAKEMFEGGSGNEDAETIASILKDDIYPSQRERLKRYGVNIATLEEWLGRQSHNVEEMIKPADTIIERMKIRYDVYKKHGFNHQAAQKELRNIAFQRWKNYILPRLDERTFKDVEPSERDKWLRQRYNNLIFGRRNTYTAPDINYTDDGRIETKDRERSPFANIGTRKLTKKLEAQRILHFESGEKWLEYNEKYGNGSLVMTVFNTLGSSAKAISLLKRFGTNPDLMSKSLIKSTFKNMQDRDIYTPGKLNKWEKRLNTYFDMLNERDSIPVSYLGAKISSNLRALTVFSKLGGIALSSLPDLGLKAELIRELSGDFGTAWQETLFNTFKGRSQDEKMVGHLIGTWAENELGGQIARFSPFEHVGGFSSRLLPKFFSLTGMKWIDKNERLSISAWMSRYLALNKNKAFGDLEGNLSTYLQLYGINEKEWNLLTREDNIYRTENGEEYITPDEARYLSRESVAEYLGQKSVNDVKLEDVRNDLSNRLATFFVDQTDMANLRPGVEDRFFFTRGLQRGTLWGEISRMVGQFKYFGVAYINKVLKRKFYAMDNGLVDEMKIDIAGLSHVLVASTLLGYVAMNAKNVVKNRTPIPFNSPGAIMASLVQGGGLGIFGDFLLGQYDRFGHNALMDLAGPTLTSMNDAISILFRIGSMEDPTNQLFRFGMNNAPLINLFYTRPALDFLFLNGLQERISPGSLQRYERAIKENSGQEFIINPTKYSII